MAKRRLEIGNDAGEVAAAGGTGDGCGHVEVGVRHIEIVPNSAWIHAA